jgi:hypothetical protein
MIALPGYGLAQSCFESAKNNIPFSSPVFLETNNAIGYKYVKGSHWQSGHSPHKSTEGDYYAAYHSVEDCAGELADWLNRREKLFSLVNNLADYVHAMRVSGYFGCPEHQYLAGLTAYYNRY